MSVVKTRVLVYVIFILSIETSSFPLETVSNKYTYFMFLLCIKLTDKISWILYNLYKKNYFDELKQFKLKWFKFPSWLYLKIEAATFLLQRRFGVQKKIYL